jgi:CHAT domain-containing protein
MPIPGAKQEVENISEIFRSDRWTGKEATESTFIEKATGYAILHLAMHTIVNDENPMYSKLVFYQEEGQEEDNLLNTYELFDLSLNAEMAVLSACNTGYGKLQRGEGIMSLARGFLYAGVPSIVMTLWPIEDAATADIMKQFYENLAEGMQKDDALRKAKLDFLENTDMLTAHPHFWASFVNIGPAKPLNHTQSSLSTLWWIGGGLILLLLLLLWRYKNRS